ncbi:MAG: hypothetical protein ACOCM8_11410, partial [Acetivibrio ethanolgignens]
GNTSKPFALSEATKKTMPEYAGLMNTYENDAELETALENAKITAGVKATKVITTTKASRGSVKVSWKKSGSYDVDSYRIYRASSKDGSYKLVKEVKGTETSVKLSTKSLRTGKTYYYKVRGVKTVDGKKVYTTYSSQVKAVVK